MAKPITITATVDAWLTSTSKNVADLLATQDPKDAVADLGYSNWDMSTGSYPWVKVGTADITVTLMPRNDIVAEQTKVLQGELQKERAESQVRQNAILDKISKLQALTFNGAES